MRIFLIILLILTNLVLHAGSSVQPRQVASPKAVKGVLDLRNWDFEKNGLIKLNGQWEFYWHKLLLQSDIAKSQHDVYISVPGSWKNAMVQNQKLPLMGFGTFHLRILTSDKKLLMRLNTDPLMPASRYFVNGKLVGWSGIISDQNSPNDNQIKIIPELNNHFIEFETTSDTIDLIVHIVNYQVEKSGFNSSLLLGITKDIQNRINKILLIYIFLIGVFFIMCLYHLSLWFLHRKDNALLYFALICISLSAYFFHKSNLINLFFNNVDFELSYKFLRISLFSTTPAFALFIHAFFPKEYNKKIAYSIIIFGLICIILVFIFPSYIHCNVAFYYRIYIIYSVLVSLILIFVAYLHKRSYSGIFIFGFSIFGVTAINDALLNLEVIQSIDLLQFGLFAFILTQSVMLSSRISLAFNKVETISIELKNINENLENIVKVRTMELEQQKTEIEYQSQKITVQNEELELSNRQLNESLKYASRIQSALLPSPSQTIKNFPPYFILHKPKHIVSGDYFWIKSINKCLVFAVADCTGHGVPGAFMSILGISYLNEIINYDINNYKPSQILDQLRNKITHSLNQTGSGYELHDGMDISIFTIDTDTNKLYYSGAKMPIYIIRASNEGYHSYKLDPNTFGIGKWDENKSFDTIEFQLIEGDTIYTFSDGFIDQFGGAKGEKFNIINFEKLLLQIQNLSMDAQKQMLEKEFENWKGSSNQVDDVIVLGIKIK